MDNGKENLDEVTASQSILLVEDDVKLARLVTEFLTINGFSVKHIDNGQAAIDEILSNPPKLIVLDIMLPGVDGLTVCRTVREQYTGPILMLTALNDDIDEVAGLETGADGYLGKPIKPRVLLAHIRALLRRQDLLETEKGVEGAEHLIQAGPIMINAAKREVCVNEQHVELTAAEFNLLWLLAEHKGASVPREELHQKIFRLEYDGLDRNIDIRISRLRKKLGDDPRSPSWIKTIRGQGYLLINE